MVSCQKDLRRLKMPEFTKGDWKAFRFSKFHNWKVIIGKRNDFLDLGHDNQSGPDANIISASPDMYESLTFKPTCWGKNLAEILEFVADRRDQDAKREGNIECLSPILREYAEKIKLALKKAEVG
jgi:hypothetical protein